MNSLVTFPIILESYFLISTLEIRNVIKVLEHQRNFFDLNEPSCFRFAMSLPGKK